VDGRVGRVRARAACVSAALLASSIVLASDIARAETDRAPSRKVDGRLVSESVSVRPGSRFWVGLHQKIAPGWHTYWRNPGDSGQPTSIAWTLPAGFRAGEIMWPHPTRIPVGSAMSYGYEGEVLLLVEITAPADVPPGSAVTLGANASWLVCEKICIPEDARLDLRLPVVSGEPAIDRDWAVAFARARRQLPSPSPWPASFTVTPAEVTLTVETLVLDAGRTGDIWFYPFEWGLIDHAAHQQASVGQQGVTLRTAPGPLAADADRAIDGVLVVSERLESGMVTQAFAIRAAPARRAAAPAILRALGLALLGGIVLNLMPCVFPILSVKALSLVREARGPAAGLRVHGAVYTAGVLASFTLLAGALLALRAAGEQVGWGFQLQVPLVVALLAYLLFALGLSLSGVFMIGGRVSGLGARLAERPGHAGAFFTGALAATVATPCTAPFMGAAVGFAVTQPAPIALAVFEALGLGLALPYLALCVSPALLRHLPRPGPWMERLKQLLAFPLYGSAAWLVWVLARQAGVDSAGAALAGMVLIAFAAWLFEASRRAAPRVQRVLGGAVLGALAAAITLVVVPTRAAIPTRPSATLEAGMRWEPFSAQRLADLQARDIPVFVNFTAAWCITCLVNERVALASTGVTARLADKRVASLKADWTSRDPEITRMLSAFGRSGVPLYVLYPRPSAGKQPVVLPQILTERIVLDALDGA